MRELAANIIVYGGTSSAVIAAVQAKKMGKSVIIVSPDKHLGGLSSSGLGFTDSGNTSSIGGLSREFYERLYTYYMDETNWKWQKPAQYHDKGQGTPAIDHQKKACWCFEPSAAEHVFNQFVSDYDIEVYREERLNREDGVVVESGEIKTITTLTGKTYKAQVFLDATYEGDLMASAGVSYHVGREANSVYGERWNGIQVGTLHHSHWFKHDVSPYLEEEEAESRILPHVSPEAPGNYGEGDHRVQAYCFRMCLSNHPANQIPFPKPDGYDSAEYELFLRAWQGRNDFFSKYDIIPNCKTDANNHGPFSTDYIGMSWDYPEASYERRREIVADHQRYQKGLMYFVQNEIRVPKYIHDGMREWGLPKDEFVDNDNWPHQLYIREARRMIGKKVMTEHDVMGHREVTLSVGMGSYSLDSHHVQRYIKADGFVQNEGDIGVKPAKAYSISFSCLMPKEDEIRNLLVPVCVSSSHIAFGSIRMEPVFMVLGQSAATAASLAIDHHIAVQSVDYEELRQQLLKDKQILEL